MAKVDLFGAVDSVDADAVEDSFSILTGRGGASFNEDTGIVELKMNARQGRGAQALDWRELPALANELKTLADNYGQVEEDDSTLGNVRRTFKITEVGDRQVVSFQTRSGRGTKSAAFPADQLSEIAATLRGFYSRIAQIEGADATADAPAQDS